METRDKKYNKNQKICVHGCFIHTVCVCGLVNIIALKEQSQDFSLQPAFNIL